MGARVVQADGVGRSNGICGHQKTRLRLYFCGAVKALVELTPQDIPAMTRTVDTLHEQRAHQQRLDCKMPNLI